MSGLYFDPHVPQCSRLSYTGLSTQNQWRPFEERVEFADIWIDVTPKIALWIRQGTPDHPGHMKSTRRAQPSSVSIESRRKVSPTFCASSDSTVQ